jgi:hypothetical protein
MWLLYLEAAVALGLAVFIVWFTLPKKKPPAEKGDKPDGQ